MTPEGQGPDESTRPPLVVDLDCTLLRSDTLVEGICAGFFQKPFATAWRLPTAVFGRASFKNWVFRNISVDYEAIPANEDLLAYLRAQKLEGREIHLVSAADQGVVDKIAGQFDVFDTATGSTPGLNLKGRRKRDHIRERFGDNFVYAGDSGPDMHIWRHASGAIYAGRNPGIAKRLSRHRSGLEAEFSEPRAGLSVWLKALRLHQWAKNLLLFAPLILAHLYTDITVITRAALAFLFLGIAASGTYLVNDLSDLSADRRHRSKRNRPLASARLPVHMGMFAAPILIGGGLAGAFFVTPIFGYSLLAYLVVTVSYSLRFKRAPLLDVFILAGLYTLRIVMGTAVIGAPFSLWLLTFSMFFFFSLSLAKRHVEVAADGAAPDVLIRGRGYYPSDWPLTLGLGLASGAASILILVLYLVDEAYGTDAYKSPAFLGGIPVIIALWMSRIWLLAHRRQLDDDPVAYATHDRLSIFLGFCLVALLAAATLL